MALPRKLKDFNLFADGNNYQGQVPELTLPELTRATEEYRGGGMDGTLEMDMGQEAMEFEWQLGGIVSEAFEHYGAAVHDAGLLRFMGSYEDEETGDGVSVEIVMRGRHKALNMGDVTAGQSNHISITSALSYIKISAAGEVLIEIDIPGNVFRVRGTDRLAERRQRLGL